ncbi:hypothetical protein BJ508DRAFT_415565 [Ascobolus immersus RN42]|uniref:General stress protein FMN-binding split barrel domain-containing protein n=1 Tax=Ascobolus immersus RN42 TaxID=1160509 RepID=A0A3N4I252_ASCIM|nr:hypothetical protein BJ508DRAFT_415565 [Ascobolus immersus RN42]
MSTQSDKPADPYKEKNVDNNLSIQEKVDGLVAFVKAHKFAMMTTRQTDNDSLVSRCMAIKDFESGIDLIFQTNTETGKAEELAEHADVNVSFLDSTIGSWASFSGKATIHRDRETVHKYYSEDLKAWVGDLGDGVHNGGPDDPRIGIIRVKVKSVTYSLQKDKTTSIGTGFASLKQATQVAVGTITGNVPKVTRLIELTEAEVETYRTSKNMVGSV